MARPYMQFFLTDDVTPYTLQEIDVDGGATSTPIVLRIWNDKGRVLDSSVASNVMLMVAAKTGTNAFGVEDEKPVDERYIRAAVTDTMVGAAADDEPEPLGSQQIPLGAWSFLPLGRIPPDCGREVTFSAMPGVNGAWIGTLRLFVDYGSTSTGLAHRVATALGSGVLADVLEPSVRRVTFGGRIVAAGTDVVTVEDRVFAADGLELAAWENTITLNQNDSAAAALASGQSYIACVSQPIAGGAAVGTKGVKSATPVKPTMPADHIFRGWVTVAYEVGGTSVIDQADVDQSRATNGDFAVEIGTGLNLTVGGGRGLSTPGDLEQLSDAPTTVTLVDDTANQTVYLSAIGVPTLTAGVGSYPLASADAAAGAITALRDLRLRRSRALDRIILKLSATGLLSTAPLTDQDIAFLEDEAWLESVTLELEDDDPAWTAGSVIADIRSGVGARGTGVTIYTGDAGHVYKPAVAFDALRGTPAILHLVRGPFPAGTRFELDLVDGPTTGGGEAAQTVHALLAFRRF